MNILVVGDKTSNIEELTKLGYEIIRLDTKWSLKNLWKKEIERWYNFPEFRKLKLRKGCYNNGSFFDPDLSKIFLTLNIMMH
jgi:hypothetical protein